MNDSSFAKIFPWAVLALAVLYLGSNLLPRQSVIDGFNVEEFGRLPVQDGGRIKPLDAMARASVLAVNGRQTFVDDKGTTLPAIKWLLDVFTSNPRRGGPALGHPVFRIENDQVLNLLKLKERSGFRYALNEFSDYWEVFEKEEKKARGKDPERRSLYEVKLLELKLHVDVYLKLAGFYEPRFLPAQNPSDPDWLTLRDAVEEQKSGGPLHPLFSSFTAMLGAYGEGKSEQFNINLEKYRKGLEQMVPHTFAKANFEVLFNRFAPFYHCMVLSVIVLLLGCVSWLGFTKPMQRAAFWLALLTLLVQSWALIGRIYISGRPPVTNLYSSAIFIGWGCTGLCLFLEWVFPIGIPLVVAAVTSFVSLFISHNLMTGDTMEMLQAVLDTNFWLATHVVCVTMGYSATLVAGTLGAMFVLLGLTTPVLQQKNWIANMGKMIYGVVCFAMLLSFTGTVLGGIWADYSWGRFWGWDPKENGALLIVLWNALVLHAQWGGLKQRGLAVLVVGGNIVTAWSWFGTNMLGVGLHSYGGQTASARTAMISFVVSQLVIMGIGLIPTKHWASYQVRPAPAKVPVPT